MPQHRHLGASVAAGAALLLAVSSVAAAHGPHFGPHGFDTEWVGTDGDDTFDTPAQGDRDLLIGLGGNDTLESGDRRDVARGGTGDDSIATGPGSDKARGGPGNDTISDGANADLLKGGYGDTIMGDGGHDVIHAQAGNDTIDLGEGRDAVRAGGGSDTIYAADGMRDRISCSPGKDSVKADRRDRISHDCELVVRVAP